MNCPCGKQTLLIDDVVVNDITHGNGPHCPPAVDLIIDCSQCKQKFNQFVPTAGFILLPAAEAALL